jgi:hypothetical protein
VGEEKCVLANLEMRRLRVAGTAELELEGWRAAA